MTNTYPTWKRNHDDAMISPRPGFESALVKMYGHWIEYSVSHERRYGTKLGDDAVLGPEWAAMGRALLGLLNGETGRLDCGTLDAKIRNALTAAGFEAE